MKILLYELRSRRGVTLRRLSADTRISKSALSRIENQEVSPTASQMEAIARALRIKITDLMESDFI